MPYTITPGPMVRGPQAQDSTGLWLQLMKYLQQQRQAGAGLGPVTPLRGEQYGGYDAASAGPGGVNDLFTNLAGASAGAGAGAAGASGAEATGAGID